MVAVPNFCIDLTSGLFGGASITPFLLTGLTQYFGKMPSQSHCMRDRWRDAASTALSAIDWYSERDRLAGCFCLDVGKGLLAPRRVGRTSSVTDNEGDERDAGV